MKNLSKRLAVFAAATVVAGSASVAIANEAGATVPACGNASLAVTRAPSVFAGGHAAFDLLFRNVSASSCTLYGYPGLDALNSQNQVLAHATRTLSGYMGGPGAIHLVTVAPGHFASARVEWLNHNPVNGNACTYSAKVATTPANTTHTVRLPVSVSICVLQVHPTVAGTNGNYPFAVAQEAWIAGSKAISANQGLYWTQAENDLKTAGSEFTTQIAQLKQLIALPDANQTPAQNAQYHHDINALNTFFGTPGLYS